MYHHVLLVLHLLAASIWVGGHLFLSLRFLPEAIKSKEVTAIQNFKNKFEPIGMPALVVLLLTGILMAYDYDVTFTKWFSFSNAIERVVSLKLILLLITVGLAVNAQLFLFPKLTSKDLPKAAFQIILVTVIGVAMLVLGSLVRIGGL
ncbi:copper resistance protein CopD [Flavobacterium silvisoli]|uniref:Copper resistance protein CopD n=1 Tax=Flavobacterium silvisoli TaxID=2529433 RepID=A0A4Q9Z042_9FLAO|nr:CopD family protein [Flavobacterium silvisoli]TBX67019.1 copper resistance protein CopD [Flavobacterium silvisoli]